MKTRKRVGRVIAVMMAVLMAVGILPFMDSVYVEAAETANTANEKINDILGHDDYVQQMSRYRKRSVKTDGTYSYSNPRGICTWCAFTNLLNRKVALASISKYGVNTPVGKVLAKTYYNLNKFDIKGVASHLALVDKVEGFNKSETYVSSDNKNIWVGNKETIKDSYDAIFRNNLGLTYQGTIVDLSGNSTQKKKTLKNALDAHPEGIVIQYTKDSNNMHGIVLTGYYYKGAVKDENLSFTTIDTAGTYGDGLTKIEDAYIGKKYGSVNTIMANTKFYVYVGDPVYINLSGFKSSLPYGKAYSIPGKIRSDTYITKIEAKVCDARDQNCVKYRDGHKKGGQYVTASWEGATLAYDIPGSKEIDSIAMGGLNKGDYFFEVRITDENGKIRTARVPFSVK